MHKDLGTKLKWYVITYAGVQSVGAAWAHSSNNYVGMCILDFKR